MNVDFKNTTWYARNDLNVEEMWESIHKIIMTSVSKNVPKSTNRKQKSIWMNSNALAKVRKKRDAYQRYLATKDGKDYLAYTKARNQVKHHCRKTVKEFERSLANEVKRNPKAFYKYAKSKSKVKEHIPTLITDDQTADTDPTKADLLNKCFTQVFTNENLDSDIEFIRSRNVPDISNDVDYDQIQL